MYLPELCQRHVETVSECMRVRITGIPRLDRIGSSANELGACHDPVPLRTLKDGVWYCICTDGKVMGNLNSMNNTNSQDVPEKVVNTRTVDSACEPVDVPSSGSMG